MKVSRSLTAAFPTYLWRARIQASGAALEALRRECHGFRALDGAGGRWSRDRYPGGYTSYSSITDLPDRSTRFARLRARIDAEVRRFARALEIEGGGARLRMTDCWINIMGPGCTHAFHLHPLSAISGTYYVHVPRGAAALKVEDPRIACFMGSPPRKARAAPANRRYLELTPRPGELILFESWLKHEVPVNRLAPGQERVSVSFNYGWV